MMTFWEWARFAVGSIFLLGGVFMLISAVIGNYRFGYALCRMHAAGLGDTLGILLLFAGITVFCGISFFTLKLALIVLLLWCSGPALSHLIMRTEREKGSPADGKGDGRK